MIAGLAFCDEGPVEPATLEDILRAYNDASDSTGDHDQEDPTEEKEEDADASFCGFSAVDP